MSDMQAADSAVQPPDPRIATLARELSSLEGALRTGRWVRLILLVVIVAVTLALTWRFVGLANRLQGEENLNALMKAGEKRFEQQLPLVRKELQTLVDDSSPVVTQAFYARAKEDLPKFLEAMRAQRDPLVEELKGKLTERLNRAYLQAAHAHVDAIRETIPEVEDPAVQEKVEAHFDAAFAQLVDKYYIKQLEQQMEVMFKLWDEFPAEQRGPNDPPLPDILIGHLLEVASSKLSSTDTKVSVAPGIPDTPAEAESKQAPAAPDKSASAKTPEVVADRTAKSPAKPAAVPGPPEPPEDDAAEKP